MESILLVIMLLVAAVAGWIAGTLVGLAITWFVSVVGLVDSPDLTITVIAAILGAAAGITLAGSRPRGH